MCSNPQCFVPLTSSKEMIMCRKPHNLSELKKNFILAIKTGLATKDPVKQGLWGQCEQVRN
jgi:hypothetical protein